MSRRTRGQQFFASPREAHELLIRLRERGFLIFRVADGVFEDLDLAHGEVLDPGRLYIGDEQVSAANAHRQPARWGLVGFDPPLLKGGELQMAVLGATNVWREGNSWFNDDHSLRVFDRLKRVLSADFIGSVDVSSRSGGVTRNYPKIRTTADAVAMWERGVRLVQEGVAGLDFRPHGSDPTR